MLSVDIKKPFWKIWKSNALQIISLCAKYDIPFIPNEIDFYNGKTTTFILPLKDAINHMIAIQMCSPLSPLVKIAAYSIGVILKYAKNSNFIAELLSPLLLNNETKKDPKFALAMDKISTEYPQIMKVMRKCFIISLGVLSIVNGKNRESMLRAFNNYCKYCIGTESFDDVHTLATQLPNEIPKIMGESRVEVKYELMCLLCTIFSLKTMDNSMKNLLGTSLPIIMEKGLADEIVKEKCYELSTTLYRLHKEMRVVRILVQGMLDKNDKVSTYIFKELNKEDAFNKLMEQNIVGLFSNLFAPCDEWVQAATLILLSISLREIGINRKLYTNGRECSYTDITLGSTSTQHNRCQPIAPISTLYMTNDSHGDAIKQTLDPIFSQTISNSFSVEYQPTFYNIELHNESQAPNPLPKQENNSFEEPFPLKFSKKRKYNLASFMEQNKFVYSSSYSQTPNEQSNRFVPQGEMSKQSIGPNLKYKQLEALNVKYKSGKGKVTAYRKYRKGELPDMEITIKDIIVPFMALCKNEMLISSEMLVMLCNSYFASNPNILKNVEGVIVKLLQNNSNPPLLISVTLCKLLYESLKIENRIIMLPKPFIESQCNEILLLLLENNITTSIGSMHQDKKMKITPKVYENCLEEQFGNLSVENSDLFITLYKKYAEIGCIDQSKEMWNVIGKNSRFFLEAPYNSLSSAIDYKNNNNLKEATTHFGEIANQSLPTSIDKQICCEMRDIYEKLQNWDKLSEFTTQFAPDLLDYTTDSKHGLSLYIKPKVLLGLENEVIQLIENKQQDKAYKTYIETHYNCDMAFLYSLKLDYDKASYYNQRTINLALTKWGTANIPTKRIILQEITKAFDVHQFIVASSSDLITTNQIIEQWSTREPNLYFDSFSVWDDIIQSRMLLQAKLRQIHHIAINSCPQMLLLAAKGSYKRGLFESSDCYLKSALKCLSQSSNAKVAFNIIKIKYAECINKSAVTTINEKIPKISIVIKALENEKAKYNTELQPNDLLCFLVLKASASQSLIDLLFSSPSQNDKSSSIIDSVISTHEALKTALIQTDKLSSQTSSAYKAKIYRKISKLCYSLLAANEDANKSSYVNDALSTINFELKTLVNTYIESVIQSIQYGHIKSKNQIPHVLKVSEKYFESNDSATFLHSKLAPLPCWILISWTEQLLCQLNSKIGPALEGKLEEMVKTYPHSIFYPFLVSKSNARLDQQFQGKESYAFQSIDSLLKGYQNLYSFAEALDDTVFPEHKYKNWIEIIRDSYKSDDDLQKEYASYIMKLMYNDLFEKKEYIGDKIGVCTKKFINEWKPTFEKELGPECNRVSKLSQSEFTQTLAKINNKINEAISKLGYGHQPLSVYSEYLEQYTQSKFDDQSTYIEIPGQYECDYEPILQRHAKIASVGKDVLVLSSIRRPKRLEFHGNDEKHYFFMVKGGEDMRQDQRIQALFGIMNRIFKYDINCASRSIALDKFATIPVTNRLGIVEWICNTEPLKSMINKSLSVFKEVDITKTPAYVERIGWLKKNCAARSIPESHIKLQSMPSEEIIPAFKIHQQLLPWNLLRRSIESITSSAESFLRLKERFAQSYACLSICSYILGIGDRHLENFLFNLSKGSILGIDFGVAFDSGMCLHVPEMMPFRLTRQIEGVLAPSGINGTLKSAMVYCLNALKNKADTIIDYCDIFIKDPLLDWVKIAKSKTSGSQYLEGTTEYVDISWYPLKKMEIVKKKLSSANPRDIYEEALKETRHYKEGYYKTILTAIKGEHSTYRSKFIGESLTTEQQVEFLLDQARDPAILGRTWIGWAPQV